MDAPYDETPDAPASPQAPAAPSTPDPFASLGGGTPYGEGGWLPPNYPLPGGGTTPQPNPVPGTTPSPSTPATPTAPGTPAPAAPATPQSIQQTFRDVLQKGLTGPTPEEYGAQAATGPEANAYKTAAQRSAERQQRQAAHLNAIQGGQANSPQLAMAERGIEQGRGESEAQFIASITARNIQARRDELMQQMQIAAAMGDSEAARELQLQIAQMNAALERSGQDIQREQVGNQFTLGQGDLALRRDLGTSDVDLRRQLGQGDLDLRRYGIDVGANTAMNELGLGYSGLQYQAQRDALDRLFQ
jgi:hypothetical protein